MQVKKIHKKKKTAWLKQTKQVKKDIREAINTLSASLAIDIQKDVGKGIAVPTIDTPRTKERALWTSVAFLSLIVFGMWGINVWSTVYDMKSKESKEYVFIQEAKGDIEKILTGFSINDSDKDTDVERSISEQEIVQSNERGTRAKQQARGVIDSLFQRIQRPAMPIPSVETLTDTQLPSE